MMTKNVKITRITQMITQNDNTYNTDDDKECKDKTQLTQMITQNDNTDNTE